MVDRPIIFSAPMVRALLDGRKTQTRRLATSPLARCVPGDRLWVREAFAVRPKSAWDLPKTAAPDPDEAAYYAADFDRSGRPRWQPSIHMPRWASRLTLSVTDVRRQPLEEISEEDAIAEGVANASSPDGRLSWTPTSSGELLSSARFEFSQLWQRLHGQGSWRRDVEVVALTFAVERRNIDTTPPANRG